MQTDTVLAVPPDAAARDALLDRLRRLADIDAARVEPVGAAVARPDGALVVPRGAASATDLATVLAVRGRCDGPEAAGLAADLAQGLATLHSAGVVHGGLDVGDVVVDLNGRVLLRPRLTPPHDANPASESEDVHALARLVETLCARAGSDTDTALRAVLAPALADDPRVRPEAGTLAARVHDELDPEPLRLPEPAALAAAALASGRQRPGTDPSDGEPRHRRARRPGEDGAGSAPVPGTRATRRSHPAGRARGPARHRPASVWRPALAGAGVLVAVAVLVAGGLAFTAAPSTPSAAVAASAGPAPGAGTGAGQVTTDREDPAAAAAELTRRRAGLLAGEHDVAEVAVPGTPAHAADTAWLERARASGTRLVDARVTVLSVRLAGAPTRDRAEVVVRYVVEEHTQVGADGEAVTVPAGEPRTDTLRLAWTPDGWRVTDVV
ncbi:hypothetical protein Q6350_10565 [Isoptericola sp. b515]|uniref:hypothetical protein n=1 Tax=Isoptericola sp. b515 TaxID=3064652 RepID=UPI0027132A23|nr:hypothetical protein [Isoptericola sp. b515]MDO8148875.1 hypothetical protein [Isoptericola sp. b515]